ncbi:hypothetical protein [Mycoplasmopsis gallinacea]|uniref:Phage portal protein n=1 Tax=Mycoplasmopsis gallinacea TaxID=29556 RepID=A0A6H0V3G0_9BACT|nr:hypothetical protein [Mycoplasmopsis gallinacea]QIW62518.1 hypothetical protein GOQ20_03810 [Mycoplasmopsis gallinacea]
MALTNKEIFERGIKLKNNIFNKKGVYANGEYIVPDSKSHFEEQGANIQMISLATDLPEIVGTGDIEKFKEFLYENNFLEIIQKLEYELYKKGSYALGFNEFGEIKTGEVLEYRKTFSGRLLYLKVKTNTIKIKDKTYEIIEEWDTENNPGYVREYAINTFTKITIKASELFKDYKQSIWDGSFIPYVVFKNRADEKPDIAIADESLFQMLDVKLKALMLDTFYSSPIPAVSWNQGGLADKVINALFSQDGDRIVKFSTTELASFQKPLEIIQVASQSTSIMANIESIKQWIKNYLMFKKDTGDFGTKNMHTAEVQQFNSDFEDYIETKANLRQIYYKKFFQMIAISFFSDLVINSVIVVGSTQWLEKRAQKALSNQNGVIINQGNNEASENGDLNNE